MAARRSTTYTEIVTSLDREETNVGARTLAGNNEGGPSRSGVQRGGRPRAFSGYYRRPEVRKRETGSTTG